MQNWSSGFGSDGVNSRLKELWGEALGVVVDSSDGKMLSLMPTGPQLSPCGVWLVLEMAPLLCRTDKDNLAPGASSLPTSLFLPREVASALGSSAKGAQVPGKQLSYLFSSLKTSWPS